MYAGARFKSIFKYQPQVFKVVAPFFESCGFFMLRIKQLPLRKGFSCLGATNRDKIAIQQGFRPADCLSAVKHRQRDILV